MKKPKQKPPDEVVHLVRGGRALCGKLGLPIEWERNHKWVIVDDARRANCKPCKEIAKTEKGRSR